MKATSPSKNSKAASRQSQGQAKHPGEVRQRDELDAEALEEIASNFIQTEYSKPAVETKAESKTQLRSSKSSQSVDDDSDYFSDVEKGGVILQ